MKAKIVKIGNSRGVRIPKPMLEQTGIAEDVELVIDNDQIIIRPIIHPRAGWEEAFESMAQNQTDGLIDGFDTMRHSWDEAEWEW